MYFQTAFARTGFPQISYRRYAECLMNKGYKLMRLEQVENSEMAMERCENRKNFIKDIISI